ncbi:MAG TPA: hypothetical protein VFD17_00670 [Clostridia bacterium]|nr:hypothetical protein [Clostridia bacterium]
MMKYQHNHSTFIPKERSDPNPNTFMEETSGPSRRDLTSQIEEYNNMVKEYDDRIKNYNSKIRELEEQLDFKDDEIRSFSDLVFSLEEEIRELKNAQDIIDTTADVIIDTAGIDRLNIELSSVREENAELKKEIATQSEHMQLLYVLVIILAVI